MFELTWYRGDFPDSVNRVAVAVTRPDGSSLDNSSCDSDHRSFLRSAAKPGQALGPVVDGVLERYGLSDRHLALACGSHNGSDAHTRLVAEILDAAGVPRDLLTPGDDGQGGPLRHQCSGNHALALAWCAASGWPLEGYLHPDHPAQVAVGRWMRWWLGAEPEQGPDGCGMVAYRSTLADSARAFARLAQAAELAGWESASGPDRAEAALGRCGAAIVTHPELVRWPGQLDTELMLACRSDGLVAKCGAEGFWACGSASGWGLALRVLDGAERAWPPAGLWAVRELLAEHLDSDLDRPALDAIAHPSVVDAKGDAVGRVEARWV
ncbi:MAG: asparaginase [Microthrixaceae bacterium]